MAKKVSKKKQDVKHESAEKEQEVDVKNEKKEEVQSGADESNEEVDEEKENLKAECEDKADDLVLVKKAYEELNDKHLPLQDKFDNYRKRTLKEKMELTKSAGESILTNILPVIDDFDRANQMLSEASDIKSVREGIELIYNKFLNFLNQNGVKEIDAKEVEFDTDLHEAITKIPAPKEDLKGKVVDCVQKGYTLNDKVIRFSKVVIGE